MKARSCVLTIVAFLAVSQSWSSERNAEPTLASVVRVLATPDAFDGKLVRLAGYCHLGFESDALYLHREDYVFRLPVNAVKLDLGERKRDAFAGVSGHYANASRFRSPRSSFTAFT